MKRPLFTMLGILVSLNVFADDKPIHFPRSIEVSGFQAAAFDVGAAYVTGQPSEEALRKLAKQGFTTVVSVRTQREMDDRTQVPFDEPALCKDLGLTYVHIPFENLGPDLVKQYAKAMNASEGKVLLHCTVAWRATYMWMAYLVMHRKQSVDEAWKAGMNMSVTVDRSALMLDSEVSYTAVPRSEGSRRPKLAVLSKPDSNLKITSPKVIQAPTSDFRAFVLWDLGDVLVGSQPNKEQLRELAGKGVKTVVNLRALPGVEALKKEGFDEEAVSKELGIKYVSVPLAGYQTFTPEALARIAEALGAATGRVLLHCADATRSTQAFVPYLVKYQQMELDEATKVGEAMRWTTMFQDLLGADFRYTLRAKAEDADGD